MELVVPAQGDSRTRVMMISSLLITKWKRGGLSALYERESVAGRACCRRITWWVLRGEEQGARVQTKTFETNQYETEMRCYQWNRNYTLTSFWALPQRVVRCLREICTFKRKKKEKKIETVFLIGQWSSWEFTTLLHFVSAGEKILIFRFRWNFVCAKLLTQFPFQRNLMNYAEFVFANWRKNLRQRLSRQESVSAETLALHFTLAAWLTWVFGYGRDQTEGTVFSTSDNPR